MLWPCLSGRIGGNSVLVLVAVLNQNIEIGIDQCCLVTIGDPKRYRLDPVFPVGLLFEFGIADRVAGVSRYGIALRRELLINISISKLVERR